MSINNMSIDELLNDPILIHDEQRAIKNNHMFKVATKAGRHKPWITAYDDVTLLSKAFRLADEILKSATETETVGIFRDGYVYWTSKYPVLNSTVLNFGVF